MLYEIIDLFQFFLFVSEIWLPVLHRFNCVYGCAFFVINEFMTYLRSI